MKTSLITIVMVATLFGQMAQAAESSLSSQAPSTQTYKISDGYDTYIGHGETSLKAREQAWESCVSDKVMRYEARYGATPDADTADLFIDACINR